MPSESFSVADEFTNACWDSVRECQRLGYKPTLFIRMLGERGALETARTLLGTSSPSDGFTRLWELNRLSLTVEAIGQRPEFASLFSPEVLATAQARLAQHGYPAEL